MGCLLPQSGAAKKLFTRSRTSLSIQIAAAHQVKVTDKNSKWKPHRNDDGGDILPTRSPHIGKNQCQTDGASLFLAAFSVMCEDFMLSMTRTLQCSKNKARLSTQKEQHYFPPFSAVSLPGEDLVDLRRWLRALDVGGNLILQDTGWATFQAAQ